MWETNKKINRDWEGETNTERAGCRMTSSEYKTSAPLANLPAVGHYLGDRTDVVDLRGVVMLVHLLTDVEQKRCIFLIALHPQGHEALHRLQQLQLPVLQLHQTLVGVAQVPAEPHLARKARTLSLSLSFNGVCCSGLHCYCCWEKMWVEIITGYLKCMNICAKLFL